MHVWDENRLFLFVCFFDKVIMHVRFIHAVCLGACGYISTELNIRLQYKVSEGFMITAYLWYIFNTET